MDLGGILVLQAPEDVPTDRSSIPPEALVGLDAWAVLQGVSKATVESNRSRHNARRGTSEERLGDMPEEDVTLGNSPFWRMQTYRAWEASRPGKGTGAGRKAGSGGAYTKRAPTTLRIPGECPHCGTRVRAKDLPADPGGKRVRSMALPAPCPHCRKVITGADLLAREEQAAR